MKSFAKIYSTRFRMPDIAIFNRKLDYLTQENVDFEGRSIQTSVYRVDIPNERYKGLTAVDFCLENQLAVGVALNPIKCNLVNSSEEDSQIK